MLYPLMTTFPSICVQFGLLCLKLLICCCVDSTMPSGRQGWALALLIPSSIASRKMNRFMMVYFKVDSFFTWPEIRPVKGVLPV